MTSPRSPRLALCAALSFFLVACGGGGGAPVSGVGIGGTGKPGVTFGNVQSTTGGVTVAGTTFDASTATVTIGGAAAAAADLKPGHVALVQGTVVGDSGTASSIEVEEVVKGALEAKPGAALLTVQGQSVEIDALTMFGPGISPASADGLLVGDLLEVWGFVKAPGVVRATRIERETSLSERRVVGFAQNVNTGSRTFTIGALTVRYDSADVSRLPGGDPVVGQVVRARGALGMGGDLVASRVDAFSLDDDDDNDNVEVEGFVAALLSASSFTVGGVTVQTSAQTVFVGGTILDVMVGSIVEVEGSLAAGVLTARRVELEAGVKIEADVEQKVGDMLTFVGFPGLIVLVDGQTEYDGDAASLADVGPGDHLEIEARIAGPGTVLAVDLKEVSADTDVRFQGPVDASPAPADPIFHILGVVIDTTPIPTGKFESETGAIITRSAFFAALTAGRVVQVQGTLVGGNPVWDEAELDDD